VAGDRTYPFGLNAIVAVEDYTKAIAVVGDVSLAQLSIVNVDVSKWGAEH
jgi:hypothetical protein